MKNQILLLILAAFATLIVTSNDAQAQCFRRSLRSCGGCGVSAPVSQCGPRFQRLRVLRQSCNSPCNRTMNSCAATSIAGCCSTATTSNHYGGHSVVIGGKDENGNIIDFGGGVTQETCQQTYIACMDACRKECPQNLSACQKHCECNRQKCDPTINATCNDPKPSCLVTPQPNPNPMGAPNGGPN